MVSMLRFVPLLLTLLSAFLRVSDVSGVKILEAKKPEHLLAIFPGMILSSHWSSMKPLVKDILRTAPATSLVKIYTCDVRIGSGFMKSVGQKLLEMKVSGSGKRGSYKVSAMPGYEYVLPAGWGSIKAKDEEACTKGDFVFDPKKGNEGGATQKEAQVAYEELEKLVGELRVRGKRNVQIATDFCEQTVTEGNFADLFRIYSQFGSFSFGGDENAYEFLYRNDVGDTGDADDDAGDDDDDAGDDDDDAGDDNDTEDDNNDAGDDDDDAGDDDDDARDDDDDTRDGDNTGDDDSDSSTSTEEKQKVGSTETSTFLSPAESQEQETGAGQQQGDSTEAVQEQGHSTKTGQEQEESLVLDARISSLAEAVFPEVFQHPLKSVAVFYDSSYASPALFLAEGLQKTLASKKDLDPLITATKVTPYAHLAGPFSMANWNMTHSKLHVPTSNLQALRRQDLQRGRSLERGLSFYGFPPYYERAEREEVEGQLSAPTASYFEDKAVSELPQDKADSLRNTLNSVLAAAHGGAAHRPAVDTPAITFAGAQRRVFVSFGTSQLHQTPNKLDRAKILEGLAEFAKQHPEILVLLQVEPSVASELVR